MFDSTKEDLKDILKKVDAGIVGVPADRIIRTNFGRDIQLDLSKPEFEFEHDLFPLNQVFDHTDWYFSWRGHWKARKPDRFDLETKFFKGIVENIQRYKMPIIRLDKKNTREAICLVFEKVNVGGKKLDAFELVTAIYAASSFDLREDWHGPVGKPAQGRSGRMIDKDNPRRVLKEVESTDFLQACTLLHTRQVRLAKAAAGAKDDDLPAISCKREALLGLPLAGYRAHADAVEEGFIEAAGFLNELKIILAKDVPYAERGPRAIAEAVEHGGNTDFESGFEQAVWQALTARGLSVDTQIGCAGYRVDLAVRDPDRPGSYLLGIECDGAAYHSAKTARDRDRLRQSVLEGLGWRIERIWSTEWRVNQERCLRQIDQAIESARKHQSDIRESRLKSTVQTVVRPEESSTPPHNIHH